MLTTKPLLPVFLLAAAGAAGEERQAGPAPSSTDFARQFQDPPPSCRILKINHGWSGEEAARAGYVSALRRQGFGGAVTNVNFGGGYVTNPAQWAALRAGMGLMRNAGLDQWLYDEAGYPSGRAGGLVLQGHPEREARALLATSAHAEVAADGSHNIGPKARASASSTDATAGVYAPHHVNDGNKDTRDWRHWSNDPAQVPSRETPQWVLLEWDREWSVKQVVFHTMEGYIAQDYAIEYWADGRWHLFADADVQGNTAAVRAHVSTAPVTTRKVRVLGRRGSAVQEQIVRIVEVEVIAADGDEAPTCTLVVPPGKLHFARAFREERDGGIALDGSVDLPAPVDGKITWRVLPGRWQLLAVSEDRLFDGSQVDFSGVPQHAPYVNLMDPDTVSTFLRITHDAYAKELGPDLGAWFVSTFTDEPSLLACYYAKAMPWSPIAWHPRLSTEFTRSTGRDLAPELPLLFADGAGAARARYDFWRTVADAFRENYFGRIRAWCREHRIPSGGHLLLEEDIRFHVPLYGDLFACLRELDVPGIDVLSCDPAQSPWFTARLASSAGELEGTALVMSETSDFVEMWAKPPKPVSTAEFRGTINRLLLGGVNRFNTYSPFRDLKDHDLVQLNEWTGRCCLALTGGVRNASIGVLYPIETAWTRFRPSSQGTRNAGPLTDRLAGTIRQVDNLLYTSRREFSYIDSRTLVEAHAQGGELQLRNLAWSVVVLPDTDTLPDAAWEALERFWQAGGVVIAAGSVPLNSERELPSARARTLGTRLFGRTPGADPADPSWAANPTGGIGVYLPPGRVGELPAVLNALLGPDLQVGDGTSPLRIARRAINGQDVFLVINDSPGPWQGRVALTTSARAGQVLDPATGSIRPLADPARVDLDLEPWGAAILRLEGVTRVPRLRPDRIEFAPTKSR